MLAHGRVGWLQIPAVDVAASNEFYEAVFEWKVSAGGGFNTPDLPGEFITDRRPAADATGPLFWVMVDDLAVALRAAESTGGAVLTEPFGDSDGRQLAIVADPAGNSVGLVHVQFG